jgi:hypothetical protein
MRHDTPLIDIFQSVLNLGDLPVFRVITHRHALRPKVAQGLAYMPSGSLRKAPVNCSTRADQLSL